MRPLQVFQELATEKGMMPAKTNSDLSYIKEYNSFCSPSGEEMSIRILGINTAWACIPSYRRYPAIPTCADAQLERLIKQSNGLAADITILCMHHPVSWMWSHERGTVRKLIELHVDFVLRGHEHLDWISPFSQSSIELATGATFGHDTRIPEGYLLAEFDSETRLARVFQRQIDRRGSNDLQVEAKNPYDTRDADGGIVIPLSKSGVQREDELSRASIRRVGYRPGYISPIGRQPLRNGVIITADIIRFSQLNHKLQEHAISSIWDCMSRSLACRDEDNIVAFSPLSDGLQIAYEDIEPDRLANALKIVNSCNHWMQQRSHSPDVRYGIACGSYVILASSSLQPVMIGGATANLSRRLAYKSGAGTVLFSTSSWDQLVEHNEAAANNYKDHLVDIESKTSTSNKKFILINQSSRPTIYMGTVMEGAVKQVGDAHLCRNSREFDRLRLILESMQSSLIEGIDVFSVTKNPPPSIMIHLHAAWVGSDAQHRLSPLLTYHHQGIKIHSLKSPSDYNSDAEIDTENELAIYKDQSIRKHAFESNDTAAYFQNKILNANDIDNVSLKYNSIPSIDHISHDNDGYTDAMSICIPNLIDRGFCGCIITLSIEDNVFNHIQSDADYLRRAKAIIKSSLKDNGDDELSTLAACWVSLHFIAI